MADNDQDKIRPAREEGTGTFRDEATATLLNNQQEAWFANVKRTYDEYQQESLESIRRNRTVVDKTLSDAQVFDNATRANILAQQAIANQALQNAVETANMVGKNGVRHTEQLANQHTAHRDLATDAAWEDVEEAVETAIGARSVTIDDTSLKAIGAAVAAAVVQALSKPQAKA